MLREWLEQYRDGLRDLFYRLAVRLMNKPLSTFLIGLGVFTSMALLGGILIRTIRAGNTGFEQRQLWDWLELLVIPIFLTLGVWWLNRTEKKTERHIARQKREQDSLELYFDRMTEILLTHELRQLRDSSESEVVTIARARTLTILRTLSGNRKGQVLQFLSEAKLINGLMPVVSLSDVDLSSTTLVGGKLYDINLVGTDMRAAYFALSEMPRANLGNCYAPGIVLKQCRLRDANLLNAYLPRADLTSADLKGANLTDVTVTGAALKGARYNVGESGTKWPKGFDPDAAGAILVEVDENNREEPT